MDRTRLSAEAARLDDAKQRLSRLQGTTGASGAGEEEARKASRFDFIFKVVLIGDAVRN